MTEEPARLARRSGWVVGAVDCTYPSHVSVDVCSTLDDVAALLMEWCYPDPTAEDMSREDRAVADGVYEEIRELLAVAREDQNWFARGTVGETWVVTVRRLEVDHED